MMVAQAIAVPSESVTEWPFAFLTSAPVRTVTPRLESTRCAYRPRRAEKALSRRSVPSTRMMRISLREIW
jgi:hypothetical protein